MLNYQCVNEVFNWLKDALKRRDWRMIISVIGNVHDYLEHLEPKYKKDDIDRVVDYFIMKELYKSFYSEEVLEL